MPDLEGALVHRGKEKRKVAHRIISALAPLRILLAWGCEYLRFVMGVVQILDVLERCQRGGWWQVLSPERRQLH